MPCSLFAELPVGLNYVGRYVLGIFPIFALLDKSSVSMARAKIKHCNLISVKIYLLKQENQFI